MNYKKQIFIFSIAILLFLITPSHSFATGTAGIYYLSPGSSVNLNQTVNFSVRVTGFTNPTYFVADSTDTSTITTSNINSSGNFSWTVKERDLGTHTITVTVSDSTGTTATVSQTITVGTAYATVQSISPGENVVPKQRVTFTVLPRGFTSPQFSVSDSIISATSPGISSDGLFDWTPNIGDVGPHNMTIRVYDSIGNSAVTYQKINVLKPQLTIGTTTPGTTVGIGTPINFTVIPIGLSNPTYMIKDIFGGNSSLSNANIGSTTGEFRWTPKDDDRGTHYVTIKALDDFGNTAEVSVNLVVNFSKNNSTQITNSQNLSASNQTSSNKYKFTRGLSVGSKGVEVSELQKRLTSLGLYSGPITGTFGPLTRTAVMKLQAKHNLEQLGSIGPKTRVILNN